MRLVLNCETRAKGVATHLWHPILHILQQECCLRVPVKHSVWWKRNIVLRRDGRSTAMPPATECRARGKSHVNDVHLANRLETLRHCRNEGI